MATKEANFRPDGDNGEDWVIRVKNGAGALGLGTSATLSVDGERVLRGSYPLLVPSSQYKTVFRGREVEMYLSTTQMEKAQNISWHCQVRVDGRVAANFDWDLYTKEQVATNAAEETASEALNYANWERIYVGDWIPLRAGEGYTKQPEFARGILLHVGQSAVLSPHAIDGHGGWEWGTPTWRYTKAADRNIASVQRRYDNRIVVTALAPGHILLDFYDHDLEARLTNKIAWGWELAVQVLR